MYKLDLVRVIVNIINRWKEYKSLTKNKGFNFRREAHNLTKQ